MLLYHVVLCVTNERELESIADKTFYEEFKNLTHKNDFLLGRAKSAVTLYKFMLDKGYGNLN